MTSSRLMPTSEVAKCLGISRQTVSWRVARGYLTPVQRLTGPSGAFLFDAEQIEALAADAAPTTTKEGAAS